ncbi:hypothetical protein [Fluviispira multicolorata]|uniref:Uncharacterized protein n=1 Tax=Fluviispira multicolorata TaxID=2654512 RepID=A0A833JE57_9BACT|nr:hypothetical protein [Fluviispira multicolorata]KAB8032238.1 hypothetical protein GCL57_06210 [Fluviispira multicolorata]
MAFIILPPTVMISENPETAAATLARAKAYQEQLLQQLGIAKNQQQTSIVKGAYRGTRIFLWNKSYNAYLATYFSFPNGKKQNDEYLETASLIRHSDCVQMGSVWKIINKSFIPISMENSTEDLLKISNRTFIDKSPLRVDTFFNFRSEYRLQNILETFVGEKLAANGIQNLTNLSRIVCKEIDVKELKSDKQLEYPARAHRDIIINFSANLLQEKETWPKVNYKAQLNSGVFAEKHEDLFSDKIENYINPQKIADDILTKVVPLLHDIRAEEFKIIRRYRGWVYLNRGRAFGLQVGMRLVGPNHSTFHIIRYLPEVNGEIDSCIAFIRYEDKEKPVLVGDILKIDPTLFPKAKISDTNLNK